MNDSLYKLKKLVNETNAKYRIENVFKAYSFLNEPLKDIRVVHVAGTNGKGSVSYKVAKALSCAGYRVGLFTSPHISTIRERIMVDFMAISENDFEVELSILFKSLEYLGIELSFFEILTLLACVFFKKKCADVAVIEVGLGGRLDATNVIDSNINVITSIGYDHQHLLGDTLDQIAEEKAGIIKSNAPVVLGPNALYPSIFKRSEKFLSPVYKVTKHFSSYDEENQHVAEIILSLLKDDFSISPDSIKKGVQARPLCRFEVFDQKKMQDDFSLFPKSVILDVAHNIDGLKRLKELLDKKFNADKYTVILGMSKDKDINEFCEYLMHFTKKIHLAKSNHPRLVSFQVISSKIPDNIPYYVHENFFEAMKEVIEKESGYVLVLGSFYFMSEIRKALGIKQPSDQFYLNDPILRS